VLAQQGRELEEQPPIVAGVSWGEAPGQLNTVSTGLQQVGSPLRRRFSSPGLGSPELNAMEGIGRIQPRAEGCAYIRLAFTTRKLLTIPRLPASQETHS
jgi:hypothetical protein